jgi:hypothetical protein
MTDLEEDLKKDLANVRLELAAERAENSLKYERLSAHLRLELAAERAENSLKYERLSAQEEVIGSLRTILEAQSRLLGHYQSLVESAWTADE